MATSLRISSALPLPIEAVTQRQAFLGKPGSGKSYAATLEAEQMYDAGAQFVALDPVGIWYGLRLDGKGKGIPIPVFGGLHGDIPLEPTAESGGLIADIVVDRRLTCVIDVSQFEHDREKARFAAGFANRFYFRMKASPAAVHIYLEECQEFVPQNPQKGEEQMLHDFVRMTKLGRNFGIGMSLITQRPQEVSKKALNLTECLFAFQMTGAHERKAIRDWVHAVGADENILDVLPTLDVAHAHVYSPQWLKISKVIKIAEKRTADVSSTPAVGESKVQSKPLAKVDLEQLRDQMAATIEKVKADDPKELHREIKRLRHELELAARNGVPPMDEEHRQAEIDRAVETAVANAIVAEERAREGIIREVEAIRLSLKASHEFADALAKRFGDASQRLDQLTDRETTDDGARIRPVSAPVTPLRPLPATSKLHSTRERSPAGANGVSGPQQRMVDAIARLAVIGVSPAPRTTVAAMSNQSPSSSGFEKNMSTLRSTGLIHYPDSDTLDLTDAGRSVANVDGRRMTLADLHASIRDIVSGPQWRMLEALLKVYPESMDRGALAAESNQSVTSSGFEKNLSTLRTLGFIAYPSSSEAVATSLLRPRGLR